MKSPLFSLPALLYMSISLAQAADDTIKLEPVDGNHTKRGIVQGTLNAPAEQVWNVITDYEHYTEFMPRTKIAEVRARTDKQVTFHSYLSMPWPIRDVEYVCEATLSSDHRSIEFRMSPGSGRGVKQFTGNWKLETVGEKTVVTYTLFFEPEAVYPTFLFDLGTRHSLAKVIGAIRKRVAARQTP